MSRPSSMKSTEGHSASGWRVDGDVHAETSLMQDRIREYRLDIGKHSRLPWCSSVGRPPAAEAVVLGKRGEEA